VTDQDPVDGPVRYEERERTAVITLNRPQYRNAQNSAMTYALDAAVTRAVNDPGDRRDRAGGSRRPFLRRPRHRLPPAGMPMCRSSAGPSCGGIT